jgi:hypothetical protein
LRSMKYKSKPVEIDAVQWTGGNIEEITDFVGRDLLEITEITENGSGVIARVLQIWDDLQHTWVNANIDDYIIKGTEGEFYPCAESVFERKYEPVQQTLGLYEGEMQK